jgi:hypothetical protein
MVGRWWATACVQVVHRHGVSLQEPTTLPAEFHPPVCVLFVNGACRRTSGLFVFMPLVLMFVFSCSYAVPVRLVSIAAPMPPFLLLCGGTASMAVALRVSRATAAVRRKQYQRDCPWITAASEGWGSRSTRT